MIEAVIGVVIVTVIVRSWSMLMLMLMSLLTRVRGPSWSWWATLACARAKSVVSRMCPATSVVSWICLVVSRLCLVVSSTCPVVLVGPAGPGTATVHAATREWPSWWRDAQASMCLFELQSWICM